MLVSRRMITQSYASCFNVFLSCNLQLTGFDVKQQVQCMIQHNHKPKTQPMMHICSLDPIKAGSFLAARRAFHIHIEIEARLWIAHFYTKIKV